MASASFDRMVDELDVAGLDAFVGADPHGLKLVVAVREAISADPAGAFDRFAPLFSPDLIARPMGARIPSRVLSHLSATLFRGGKPLWQGVCADVPAWVRADRRWFSLSAGLRNDAKLGSVARQFLRHHDRDLVTAALDDAMKKEAPRPAPRVKAIGNLLARYESGDHTNVWQEIRGLGPIAGALREEALAVACLTMTRVAANADLISERLDRAGWHALSGSMRTAPAMPDDEDVVALADAAEGPLPVAILAFWEKVGGVDFVWDYERGESPLTLKGFNLADTDPLCVDAASQCEHLIQEWKDQKEESFHPDVRDPYLLALAPDVFHKMNTSGGEPYGIYLPNNEADPIFENEACREPFIEYLRRCFRFGGFPGLEAHAADDDVRRFLKRMTEGLVPF